MTDKQQAAHDLDVATRKRMMFTFDKECEPEVFDFNSPEDVIIEVVCNVEDVDIRWQDHSIEYCSVIRGTPDITGAASYVHSYVGFLDYTIEEIIDCPGAGWFVVEGVTGEYIRGDGWTTDDDMTFDYKSVRPATQEEIDQV